MTLHPLSLKRSQSTAFTTAYDGLSKVLENKVRITEAFDPQNSPPLASVKEFTGLWDTGATNSVITQRVVDDCQLKPTGVTTVNHAQGSSLTETYLVGIMLPNRLVFPQLRVTKGDLVGDPDVLIGMDVIGSGDFAVTNLGNKTVFSFRAPSAERIDFVEVIEDNKSKSKAYPNTGRNRPCPCGSGKKYKRCHGQ